MSSSIHYVSYTVIMILCLCLRTTQVNITFTDPLTPQEITEVCHLFRPGNCCVPLDLNIGGNLVPFVAAEATFTGLNLDQRWLEVYTGGDCQGHLAERAEHGFSHEAVSFENVLGFSGALFKAGPVDSGTLMTQNDTVNLLPAGLEYPLWITWEGDLYEHVGRLSQIYRDSNGREISGSLAMGSKWLISWIENDVFIHIRTVAGEYSTDSQLLAVMNRNVSSHSNSSGTDTSK